MRAIHFRFILVWGCLGLGTAIVLADGAAAEHWAFKPPVRSELPSVSDDAWCRSPIDRFVLARLDAAGLTPSPEADRYALIRRVSLDLTGLPPTPEEADAFAADAASDAYEKVVDRLLDSPAYGEHWASPWLDLARYADTQGYEKDRHRDIWAYRDWVIHALNADMPHDRFTIEQIAGDLLPDATVQQKLATAFHRNTMTNNEGGTSDEEYRVVAIKDRVDATMQVWMGLTMGCAQCHTHKYDPISITEYYQFFAYFNQTEDSDRADDAPRIPTPSAQQLAEIDNLESQVAKHRTQMAAIVAQSGEARKAWESKIAAAPIWTALKPTEAVSANGATLTPQPTGAVLASGKSPAKDVYTLTGPVAPGTVTALRIDALTHPSLGKTGPGRNPSDPNFVINELVVELLPAGEGAEPVRLKLTAPRADFEQNKWPVTGSIDGDEKTGWAISPNAGQPHAAVYTVDPPVEIAEGARLRVTLKQLYGRSLTLGHVMVSTTSGDPAKASVEPGPSLANLVATPDADLSDDQRRTLDDAFAAEHPPLAEHNRAIDELAVKIEAIRKAAPSTPVMIERPADKQRTTHVHNRGNWLDPGDVVTAALPEAFGPMPSGEPNNRLGVARWLVNRDNPLTARVQVNRIWARLFGTGIVETEGDFGTQGTPPSHPQLLDWLAVEFMDTHKWSQKALLKSIVMSAAYRQSGAVDAKRLELDANNRLISRGPRFRLSAETVRDQALATSGLLTEKVGGPSVMPPQPDGIWSSIYNGSKWQTATNEDRFRRGLYTYWKRTSPYPSMVNFDAGSREVCQIRRIRTNTPLQSLVLMNDPVYVEAAGALALRAMTDRDEPRKIATVVFRRALVRPPTDRELDRLVKMYETARARFAGDGESAKTLIEDARVDGRGRPVDTAAWTVVANVVLNLDETVTKP